MILNFFERITLLGILPEQGDYTTLKIVRKLREELSPSEEEHKILQIKNDGNQITWDSVSDPMKDCQIGEKAMDVVTNSLKSINEQKKLTAQNFGLYEKFVENSNG